MTIGPRLLMVIPLLLPIMQPNASQAATPTAPTVPVEAPMVPKSLPVSILKPVEAPVTKAIPIPVPTATPTPQPVYTAPPAPTSCVGLLQETGVTDISNALNVLSKEDRNCDPYAHNPKSSACGIGQDINGCEVGYDPVAQIKWFENYVYRRYTTFANAWQHELQYGWY